MKQGMLAGSCLRKGLGLAFFGWSDWRHLYLVRGSVRWIVGLGPFSLYWNRVGI